MYANGVLKMDLARFSKFALPVQVQKRRFKRTTERLEKKTIFLVPAFFVPVRSSTLAMPAKSRDPVSGIRD